MTEWKKIKISDIAEVIGGGTPSTKQSEYWGNDIPWLTPKDLSGYNKRYISNGERYISNEGLKNSSARMLPVGSILLTSRAPIGYLAIAEQDLCTNQGFKSLVLKPGNDSEFFYYLLKNNIEYIKNMSSGSTFAEISGSQVKNLEFNLPPLETQQKIAKVLSAIDDKIELNNSLNNNLEQQAQAIFNKKFVNIESIPNNWEMTNLSTIADYLNGLAMQKFRPQKDEIGIPVLKIKELRQGFCDNQSDLCSPNIKSEYLINDGDVIFSWSGTLWLDLWCSGLCGLNQHLFKVTSSKYDKWFYYFWTKYHLNKFIAIAADKATTMGHIKREDLDKSEVLIPDNETYTQLNSLLSPLLELIIKNKVENRHLIQLRDTLLPKLMSGEIDVSNVDISTDKLSFSEDT